MSLLTWQPCVWSSTVKYRLRIQKPTDLRRQLNDIVGKILNKIFFAHNTDWDRKLPLAIHVYNTSEKKTTTKSPMFLIFGHAGLYGIGLEGEILQSWPTSRENIRKTKDTRCLFSWPRIGPNQNTLADCFRPGQCEGKKLIQNCPRIMDASKADWCYFTTTSTNNLRGNCTPYRWVHTG